MEQTPLPQKLPKLTKKQRGFVRDYMIDENGTQAALKNYDIESGNPERVANAIAVENLSKPAIVDAIETKRKSLKEALIDQGIDEKKIAEKIDVLLTASVDGIPDYNAIDKGLKHATNIYGVVEEPNQKPTGNTYNFIFSPEVQSDVKAIEDRIKARLIKPHVQEN